MSDYTPITDFSAKDAWASGDPNKVIKGSEQDAELEAIATAIATKADDSAVVHDTGTETIAGNKTLSGNTIMSGTLTMSSKSIYEDEGANVASASDCNIWVGDGNTAHLTGTTTVTDWGTAPQAGAHMRLIADAATPLTYHATTNDMNTNSQNYTCTAGDIIDVYARSTSSYKVVITPYDGRPLTSKIISITPVATTSGASVTLTTAIPSWAKRITLMFNGVSTTGNDVLYVRIGPVAGVETSSYDSTAGRYVNGDIDLNAVDGTVGFVLNQAGGATNSFKGNVYLTLEDSSDNTWTCNGILKYGNTSFTMMVGVKALAGVLTTIDVSAVGGGTFDAGEIGILYE